ncbi:hypothetical protein [Bifidobacterium sp. ESL0790]|uniref:hypothetical protein n=1 Tax=Bifidobacterium sp. ESL0790 TaxID=2983233 RepID=UPI0023F768F8|nr:hypothetical protein [Bifidobacterium sp. ESL0790]WEV72158.1 hypothetical protein OZY47_06875 [Bifidobacterium sp. ESL0790]
MADSNGFVLHPLASDGTTDVPYTAADYRMAVNSIQAAPDGTPFGGLSGIRAGSPSPLVSCDGTTVTIAAHAGWICAFGRMYSYAITRDYELRIPTSTGSYKIALTADDKAAGHGDGEKLSATAYPATTPDSQIPGMVIARIDAGVASDTALTLQTDMLITAPSLDRLKTVSGIEGQRAALADGTEYALRNGVWVPRTQFSQSGTWEGTVTKENTWYGYNFGIVHIELDTNMGNTDYEIFAQPMQGEVISWVTVKSRSVDGFDLRATMAGMDSMDLRIFWEVRAA